MFNKIFHKKEDKNSLQEQFEKAGLTAAASKITSKYGSAVKEMLTAFSGQDNESGKTMNKSLQSIFRSKINPNYETQNKKQQSGFDAEVIYVGRENAKRSINGIKEKVIRTDDLGRVNDPLYDHFLVDENGVAILGSGEQMKFIGSDPKACLEKLLGKKCQKYLDQNATITVPKDFYSGILTEATRKLESLYKQLANAQEKGKIDLVNELKAKIGKINKIKKLIKDSGITSKEALSAREHPNVFTTKEVAKYAHKAGWEQAKIGASLSGGISLFKNLVACSKGEKDIERAAKDVVKDTGKGALFSYVLGFFGTAIKGGFQNSRISTLRYLSKNNAPAVLVTMIWDFSSTIAKYAKGDITYETLLNEMGQKGVGNIGAVLLVALGSTVSSSTILAIAASMAGYAISSSIYQLIGSYIQNPELAQEEKKRLEKECKKAYNNIKKYRNDLYVKAKECKQKYNEDLSNIIEQLDMKYLPIELKNKKTMSFWPF